MSLKYLSTTGQLDDPDKVMVGDMILTRRQHRWLYSNDTIKRHGLSNKAFRWPGGRVPVVISPQFPRSFQDTIKAAGAYITQATCARFDFNVDPRSEPNHLNVVPAGSGICNALVGYNRQPSTVRLDPNMCSKGNVIHEFLHVLGFYHMHTAADRDSFIDINFNNIKDGYKGQFDKIVKEVSMFNTQYEYGVRFWLPGKRVVLLFASLAVNHALRARFICKKRSHSSY